MLKRVRSALLSTTSSVSSGVAAVSAQASRTSKQAVTVSKHVVRKARDMSAEDVQEAAKSFAGGMVLGDFSSDQSPAAHAGRIVGGVIPLVGTAATARDCAAAAHRLSKGEHKAAFDLTLGVLSFIPGARLATSAVRGAQTAMTHATKLGELAEKLEAEANGIGAPALTYAPGVATARATVEKFFANYAFIADRPTFMAAQRELLGAELETHASDHRGMKSYAGPEGYFASLDDWSAAFSTGADFRVELTHVASDRVEARLHGTLTVKTPTERTVADHEHAWTETFALDAQGKITSLAVAMNLR